MWSNVVNILQVKDVKYPANLKWELASLPRTRRFRGLLNEGSYGLRLISVSINKVYSQRVMEVLEQLLPTHRRQSFNILPTV